MTTPVKGMRVRFVGKVYVTVGKNRAERASGIGWFESAFKSEGQDVWRVRTLQGTAHVAPSRCLVETTV